MIWRSLGDIITGKYGLNQLYGGRNGGRYRQCCGKRSAAGGYKGRAVPAAAAGSPAYGEYRIAQSSSASGA